MNLWQDVEKLDLLVPPLSKSQGYGWFLPQSKKVEPQVKQPQVYKIKNVIVEFVPKTNVHSIPMK